MGELFNKLGNIGRRALKVIKNVFKKALISTAPIWGTILLILVILAALTYENTIQEGTEQEGSWKSTPYVANQFDANIEIAEDGTITTDVTPQELWDEMLKHGNEIKSYLNNSKEFAKLLHAEQITNFPDTRSDPSKEINWNDIIKPKSNRIQGIIKFKRETGGADPIDLVYVDDGTFMDWLEGYNLTGDETLRQNLLTHFTIGSNIVQTQGGGSSQNASLDYKDGNVWTDISEAIVRSAIDTGPRPQGGYCQSWVYHVYVNAGLPGAGFNTAYEAFKANYVSTDRNNIPIGAAVYATGSVSAGHVGIYVGDRNGDGEGEVRDNIEDSKGRSIVREMPLSEWIAEAERQGNTNCGGDTVTPGFLGWGWQSGSPSRFLTEEEIEKIDITSEATTPVEGETGSVGTASKSEYYVLVATWSETTENNSTTVDGALTSGFAGNNESAAFVGIDGIAGIVGIAGNYMGKPMSQSPGGCTKGRGAEIPQHAPFVQLKNPAVAKPFRQAARVSLHRPIPLRMGQHGKKTRILHAAGSVLHARKALPKVELHKQIARSRQRQFPQDRRIAPVSLPQQLGAGKHPKRDLALCQSSVQNLCKLPYPLASFQQPRVTQSTMRRAYNPPYIGTNCRLDHVPGGSPILWPIVQPREDVAVKVGEGRHPEGPRDSKCWAPSSFFSLSPYP